MKCKVYVQRLSTEVMELTANDKWEALDVAVKKVIEEGDSSVIRVATVDAQGCVYSLMIPELRWIDFERRGPQEGNEVSQIASQFRLQIVKSLKIIEKVACDFYSLPDLAAESNCTEDEALLHVDIEDEYRTLNWLIEIARKALDLPEYRFVPLSEPISEELGDAGDYEEDCDWCGPRRLDGIYPARFYRNLPRSHPDARRKMEPA
ncbi:hypothetical protein FE840_018675 (plasmid) [Peteryoungia desertarenae]|uniref:Uncharacterized protein n=1 Tax=Peteryoungia desertarenae TaxID=1813451 RepID=A0ABX6QTY6_9HYPH|nr:hypothetical protein [Peteryoungia desertarenae]QLF71672.1 hypothetical protein FE840_018675 [Peteryoungia desertarenae]